MISQTTMARLNSALEGIAGEPFHVALVADEAGDYSCAITFGHEADATGAWSMSPDSPMAAGQALGYGESLDDALSAALTEMRT